MTVAPHSTDSVPACEKNRKHSAIDRAKKSIAPQADLNDWLSDSSAVSSAVASDSIHVCHGGDDNTVTFDDGGLVYRDNVTRIPGCSFTHDVHGDCLPHVPAVLTGLLEDCDTSTTIFKTTRVLLDGGPSFARMSMGQGKVTLEEYKHYCESGEADNDVAPLYVFDPDVLKSTFASDEFHVPECFSNDVMECIDGTEYRPLPPAWLLVGVKRSGTPIHDHPLTVAWNALLVGCKLWCCLPPDVDESLLLLNLYDDEEDEDEDADFDLSALEWFRQCGKLPESAKIIVQRPGEVVYLPAGWFHVVLNVETSTAISVSLALRRDLPVVLPLLMESDEDFATFWIDRLRLHGADMEGALAHCCIDTLMMKKTQKN
jgi:histone arginine demethylase JMJD6